MFPGFWQIQASQKWVGAFLGKTLSAVGGKFWDHFRVELLVRIESTCDLFFTLSGGFLGFVLHIPHGLVSVCVCFLGLAASKAKPAI